MHGHKLRLRGHEKFVDLKDYSLLEDYGAGSFSYKSLLLKLLFEQMLVDFQHNQNFSMIYEFISAYGSELKVIKLDLIDKTHLKSNHYWLLGVISKLTSLNTIKIFKSDTSNFGKDGWKFMQKAFTYLQKAGGSIQKFEINSGIVNYSEDLLYPIFKSMPDMQILKINHFQLTQNNCKAIGKILSDFKNIRELDLTNSALTTSSSKEIADGLMRAK